MHVLDYMIIALIGYNAFSGLRQGAVRMINGILGIIIATSLSKTVYDMSFGTISAIVPFFKSYPFVYYGCCFFILLIICQAIAHFIHTIFKWSGIGIINHVLGLLLGSIKGSILALIFIIPLMILKPHFALQSSTIHYTTPFLINVIGYLNQSGFIENLFQSISFDSILNFKELNND